MPALRESLAEYLPFWGKLTSAQQTLLAGCVRERAYAKDSLLHRGEQDCVGLLLVLKGRLRVYTVSQEGKELTLYRLFPRDMCLFSAACILHSIQFDVFVSAEEPATVLHIPPEPYQRLMRESAAVAGYTNELMAARFSDVMERMDALMNKKLDARLAALLLEESELAHSEELALTHEQLAGHLGSAREVVTRTLRYLQEEGLVRLGRGRVRLADPAGLARLARHAP